MRSLPGNVSHLFLPLTVMWRVRRRWIIEGEGHTWSCSSHICTFVVKDGRPSQKWLQPAGDRSVTFPLRQRPQSPVTARLRLQLCCTHYSIHGHTTANVFVLPFIVSHCVFVRAIDFILSSREPSIVMGADESLITLIKDNNSCINRHQLPSHG